MGSLGTERLGRWAERLAAFWLRLKGYHVLGRRIRNPFGEIDLVCRRRRCVVFVEVKARSSAEAALHALGCRQQRRIAQAARCYLAERPELGGLDCRFDLVTVDRLGRLRHLTDIWRHSGF